MLGYDYIWFNWWRSCWTNWGSNWSCGCWIFVQMMSFIGFLMLVSVGFLLYKSIPPMDPSLASPIPKNPRIDWNELGIDYSDLDARKAHIAALYQKVKTDYLANYGKEIY